jgi:hypothetical protein
MQSGLFDIRLPRPMQSSIQLSVTTFVKPMAMAAV